jgi:membrane protein DedA with SNARE-associated domain
MFRVAPWKFLALDTTAAFLWASDYFAVGWVSAPNSSWGVNVRNGSVNDSSLGASRKASVFAASRWGRSFAIVEVIILN